jgi:hypothetical protein
MAKGRDKQGREQKKPKKTKKQGPEVAGTLPLRHHAVSPAPAAPRPAEQPEQ